MIDETPADGVQQRGTTSDFNRQGRGHQTHAAPQESFDGQRQMAAPSLMNELPLQQLPRLRQPTSEWLDSTSHLSQGVEAHDNPAHCTRPNVQDELLRHVLLAQAKLPVFEGDMLEYVWFRSAFEEQVARITADPSRRLHLLLQQLRGAPLTLVKGCQLMEPTAAYNRAMTKLDNKYGNPVSQALTFRSKLLSWPPIRNAQDLENFSVQLQLCMDLKLAGTGLEELDSPGTLLQLVAKLPSKLQVMWQSKAYDEEAVRGRQATFTDLVGFIERQSGLRNHPIYRTLNAEAKDWKSASPPTAAKDSNKVFSTVAAESPASKERPVNAPVDLTKTPCLFCQENHSTATCPKAQSVDINRRREMLRGLCFGCLQPGHHARYCRERAQCSHCEGHHPTVLHVNKDTTRREGAKVNAVVSAENVESEQTGDVAQKELVQGSIQGEEASFATISQPETAIAMLPVRVLLPNGNECITVAVLDAASTTTFLSRAFLQQLEQLDSNLPIRSRTLDVTTMTAVSKPLSVQLVEGLQVADWDRNNKLSITAAYAVDALPFKSTDVPTERATMGWSHLQEIPFHWHPGPVGMLIGINVPDAVFPEKSIRGGPAAPFAVKTALGWTLQGPMRAPDGNQFEAVFTVRAQEVKAQLEKLYYLDVEGIHDFSRKGPSQNDVKWLCKVESSVHRGQLAPDAGKFIIDLPFKDGMEDALKDNRAQAELRLRYLWRKFQSNAQFKKDYRAFMQKMVCNNFMEKADPGSSVGTTSYVLHHGVYHPQKPGKIRVVFNCASKYRGVALNDCLLSGPDLTNSLLGVLVRFRQEPIAFMADVDSMFYNVLVPEKQRDALRLLWFKDDGSEELDKNNVETYRLRVHLFGATSSPSVANFALRRGAEEALAAGLVEPAVCNSVKQNFYVDDCLKSVPNLEEAIRIAHGIVRACDYGGFTLSKFVSNSVDLLRTFESEKLSKDLHSAELTKGELGKLQERALGVAWSIGGDYFEFRIQQEAPGEFITRRQVLSKLSMLYDPLGLAAPVVIVARLVFRELVQADVAWDEQLSVNTSTVASKWASWLEQLHHVKGVRIQRCFKSVLVGPKQESWQLHTFVDASQEAYAAVVYLVQEMKGRNQNHVSFVVGKARVAPPKTATIPRLELVAAKLGTELAESAQRELQYSIDQRVFWTDSETVLKYLHNHQKRFHVFVANRVQAILAATAVSEWRHVPTTLNPADEATRGMNAASLSKSMWLNAPPFLKGHADQWPAPSHDITSMPPNDPELKKQETMLFAGATGTSFITMVTERASTLRKVRKIIATWLRIKFILQRKRHIRGPFGWPELKAAEHEAIRLIQEEEWSAELTDAPKQGRLTVRPDSPLYKLSPTMQNGLVCVDSRASQRCIPIVPKGRLAQLLVQEAHVQQLHFGRHSTATQVMQNYHVVGLGAITRRVVLNCLQCQRARTQPEPTRMAPLPDLRVTPTDKAFEVTGVDYFGPFKVTNVIENRSSKQHGRKTAVKEDDLEGPNHHKAYGVIFTCGLTRAVHLEVAENMSTSAFINALRRFIARRGNVRVIISDNGPNLKGASADLDKRLRLALQKIEKDKAVAKEMCNRRIEWRFNTPGASHHGRFWERLIRSVRRALTAVVNPTSPPLSIMALQTVLCECEAVLNSRPLTSLDHDLRDLDPLTPNHLLLCHKAHHETVHPPPGSFDRVATALRHQWRKVQHHANTFWRRWIKEYKPLLLHRSKWHQTAKRSLQPGDVVLLFDQLQPRQHWKLGRIMKVYPSLKDGLIRTADVKTAQGLVSRPITKLCYLETSPNENDN